MPAIKSSMITFAEYDEAERGLEITFTNGTVHIYFDVPSETYDNFINASSQGKYFNQNIKNEYRTKKQ